MLVSRLNINEDLLAEFKRVRIESPIDWGNKESECKPLLQSSVMPTDKPKNQIEWFKYIVKTLKESN